MKLRLIPALLGMSAMVSVASAAPVETAKEQQQPVRISEQQMDKVTAGQLPNPNWTETRTNPAGKETRGQGQAIDVTVTNPGGNTPPGKQP